MTPDQRLKSVLQGLDHLVNQARQPNAPKWVFSQIATTLRWLHTEIAEPALNKSLKETYLENLPHIKHLLEEQMFDPRKFN